MEKHLGYSFQVWSPYYHVAQCNQKTPIPVSLGDRSGLRKPKKDKHQLITAITSAHLPQPVSTDLTIIRLVDVIKHLPHKAFLL